MDMRPELATTASNIAKLNIVYLMFDLAKASAISFVANCEFEMPFCDMLAECERYVKCDFCRGQSSGIIATHQASV